MVSTVGVGPVPPVQVVVGPVVVLAVLTVVEVLSRHSWLVGRGRSPIARVIGSSLYGTNSMGWW